MTIKLYVVVGLILIAFNIWAETHGWIFSSLWTSEGRMGARVGQVHHK